MAKRGRRNPAMKKGAPSINPSGRPKDQMTLGKEVLQALRDSFHDVGGKDYLITMAQEDRKTYAALIAKVIPSEVNTSHTLAVIDLSDAMATAQKRLEQMQSQVIDITPDTEEIKKWR